MTQNNMDGGLTAAKPNQARAEAAASNYVTFNTALSIGVLSIILSIVLSFAFSRIAVSYGYIGSSQIKVVSLDTQALVDAQTRAVMLAGKSNPTIIKSESERFATQFNQLLESYKKAGYFIVQSEAVITNPTSANVTADFITQLVTKQTPESK